MRPTFSGIAVVTLVLLSLLGAAEGWAPKKHTPVRLSSMRAPSRTAGSPGSGAPSGGGVGVPPLGGGADPIAAAGSGGAARVELGALEWGSDGRQRRRLQYDAGQLAGQYDRQYSAAQSQHWDDSKQGLSAYDFDRPTHQGANRARIGWDPLPQSNWRDPNEPPTDAEMYQRLLDADPETQMEELAAAYRRSQAKEGGAYNSDWCRRTAIQPGESGCSFQSRVGNNADEDSWGHIETAEVQTILNAAGSILNADNVPVDDGSGGGDGGDSSSSSSSGSSASSSSGGGGSSSGSSYDGR